MKKALLFVAFGLIYLIPVSEAMNQVVNFSKDSESEKMRLVCNQQNFELQLNNPVQVENLGKVIWQPTALRLVAQPQSTFETLEFNSDDLALELESFKAKKCKISAPNLKFVQTNSIKEISASLTAANSTLTVERGSQLITKFINVTGDTGNNGSRDLPASCEINQNDMTAIDGKAFVVSASTNSWPKITNRGWILARSGNKDLTITASRIENQNGAVIRGSKATFQGCRDLCNSGTMEFEKLQVIYPYGCPTLAFKQWGVLLIREIMSLPYSLESSGTTLVNEIVFEYAPAYLKAFGDGSCRIGAVSGGIRSIQVNNVLCQIDKINVKEARKLPCDTRLCRQKRIDIIC